MSQKSMRDVPKINTITDRIKCVASIAAAVQVREDDLAYNCKISTIYFT